MSYLIWIRGSHGRIEAQKWAELEYGVGDWKRPLVVIAIPLSEAEYALTIDELKKIHPSPIEEEDAAKFKLSEVA